MLTSLWSNCFLNYVCDVGLWFHFIKYGSTWHKQNLDKIIATAKGKKRSLTTSCSDLFILIQVALTKGGESIIQTHPWLILISEISHNRLLIILVSPQHNDLKYYKLNMGQTHCEINSYSSKLIIVKMTFQLLRFDSSHKKLLKLKPWKKTWI